MKATTKEGETVRGFHVLIQQAAGKPRLRLPCTGYPPYTGPEALGVMRLYKARGFTTYALTDSIFFGEELIPLEEMETLVIQ